jgi:hypothetical protein
MNMKAGNRIRSRDTQCSCVLGCVCTVTRRTEHPNIAESERMCVTFCWHDDKLSVTLLEDVPIFQLTLSLRSHVRKFCLQFDGTGGGGNGCMAG